MDYMDVMGWFYHGGGLDLYNEFYQKELKLNVVVFPILPAGPQAFGWFKKPIQTVEDMKGMKCRQTGMAGEVWQALGFTVVNMPGGEIIPSAQRGVIDCAEWVGGIEDMQLGFHNVWKYHYSPGLHENVTVGEIVINGDVWKELSPQHQEIIKSAANETFLVWWTKWQRQNADALIEMQQKHGVQILRTPTEILLTFIKKWDEIAAPGTRSSRRCTTRRRPMPALWCRTSGPISRHTPSWRTTTSPSRNRTSFRGRPVRPPSIRSRPVCVRPQGAPHKRLAVGGGMAETTTDRQSPALLAIIRIIDGFTDRTGTIISWLSVPLVLAVAYEVGARYLFNAPTIWAYDATYMLYGSLFMLGAAYALHKGAHIRTDFFWEKFSTRRKGLIDTISYIVFFFPSLIMLLLISWNEFHYSWQINEMSDQTPWRPVLWPFKFVVPLACLLLLIQGVSELIKSIYMVRTGVELEHKEKVEI
jgi:TRAP-type mannitol/chloroaromatic compound transport system permease small subunit